MRLDSIYAINANKQNDSHSKQNADTSAGKDSPRVLFEDYLKAHIQQVSAPVITQHAENHVAGLLQGYISPLRLAYKLEPELETSAS